MYHGRIPPNVWIGDRVTISKAAQEKLNQSSKTDAVTVDFEEGEENKPVANDTLFWVYLPATFIAGFWVGILLAYTGLI